jgi:penicillin-binding protein 2
MEQFMKSFGFGARTGIDINGELAGLVPSREWKRNNFSAREQQVWFPGETVNFGIGQGYTLVTPLQLAHATAVMAARGQRFRPRLLIGTEDSTSRAVEYTAPEELQAPVGVAEEHWQMIQDAMLGVTAEARGTGHTPMRGTSYTVAGKTGTSQERGIAQDEKYDAALIEERDRDNGLFIAYAPADYPTIAIAVLVENNGGGSTTAAPIARMVLDAYFDSNEYVAQQP